MISGTRDMRKNKVFVGFMCLTMALSLGACTKSSESFSSTENSSQTTTSTSKEATSPDAPLTEETPSSESASATSGSAEQTTSGSRVLVVYFSRTGEQYNVGVIDKGNTAIVAEMIAERTGGDLFEVLPQDDYYPYTYDELTNVAKQEQKDAARPAYKGDVPDLSRYDTVFFGAPVWWGDWPMIMYTFFETNADALKGKALFPFSTHEGSGLSGFDKKLSSSLPDSSVGKGLAIKGEKAQNDQDRAREDVNEWLSDLGY